MEDVQIFRSRFLLRRSSRRGFFHHFYGSRFPSRRRRSIVGARGAEWTAVELLNRQAPGGLPFHPHQGRFRYAGGGAGRGGALDALAVEEGKRRGRDGAGGGACAVSAAAAG